jgi:transaldolase
MATPGSASRLQQLHAAGQSIWLDYIERTILHDGELQRRIRDDALTGMTSNPTIFEKAIAAGTAYDAQLTAAASDVGTAPQALFELLAADDVRTACDAFRPIYDATRGADGFVSIEVSPGVADDAERTIDEAHRLWRIVDRPNVMVKVPGTIAGAQAVRALTAAGVNVNITLLFAVEAHARVLDAFIAGLEDRVRAGQPVDRLASVASFFVSRVDSEVDKRLDAIAAQRTGADRDRVLALRGKAAIANAKMAYRLFRQRVATPRWAALAARGALVQRPLWASTSTKNPAYRDVMYVEQLIGPDTVNTLPPATLEAFRDHGIVARTIDADLPAAEQALRELDAVGVSLAGVADKLLIDGIESFRKSYESLLAGLDRKLHALV